MAGGCTCGCGSVRPSKYATSALVSPAPAISRTLINILVKGTLPDIPNPPLAQGGISHSCEAEGRQKGSGVMTMLGKKQVTTGRGAATDRQETPPQRGSSRGSKQAQRL